jgi:hypothetical protein
MLATERSRTMVGTAKVASVLVVAVIALALGDSAARATTFTVPCSGTTGDVTALTTDIDAANSAGGSNTIQLVAGCQYTLTHADNNWYGPDGLPPIASDLTIEGNGATITRAPTAPKFRLLFVGANPASANTKGYASPGAGSLTLRDLTLGGGFAQGGDSDGGGGGAGMGGAIFSQGSVTILDSTLTANTAQGGSAVDPSAGGGGGGIGTSASGVNGGGFGAGNFGGALGGMGADGSSTLFAGGGGAGFGSGNGYGADENGGRAAYDTGGAGGGPATGLGGAGGFIYGGAAGDGSGGGGGSSLEPQGATAWGNGDGGDFGAGGGGVGGGGGQGVDTAGGGGGFGAGGGEGGGTVIEPDGGGGRGGFGGGGGAAPEDTDAPQDAAAPPGFGGGPATSKYGGGGAGMGGAIFNMQGALAITNSTVASNSAIGGADAGTAQGNGIAGAVFNLNGTFTATDSTFAANAAATSASQIYNLVYDEYQARVAHVDLADTIVADGIGPFDLASDKPSELTPSNLGAATVDVSQFDLVRTMNAEEQTAITGSPLTADPLLGGLQDNGGPIQTIALMPGSPAIDAGSSLGVTTDQRGDPRPEDFTGVPNAVGGDGSDIGAFELQQACAGEIFPAECHVLGISLAGAGIGTVTGAAISCPGTCSSSLLAQSTVALIATAAAGSTFTGWSGACTGDDVCDVAMTTDQTVTATFALIGTTTQGRRPPSITDLKQTASAWREGNGLARITRKTKPPIGTVFSFNLNEPASVTLTLTRRASGRRTRSSCAALTKANAHKPHCIRLIESGAVTAAGHQGADSISFQGQLSPHKKLALGRYTITIVAANAQRQRSDAQSLSFSIVS